MAQTSLHPHPFTAFGNVQVGLQEVGCGEGGGVGTGFAVVGAAVVGLADVGLCEGTVGEAVVGDAEVGEEDVGCGVGDADGDCDTVGALQSVDTEDGPYDTKSVVAMGAHVGLADVLPEADPEHVRDV